MASILGFLVFGAAVAVAALLLFRFLAPRRTVARQPALEFAITFDSSGFVLVDLRVQPGADVRMAWPEVARIVAYKRDLFVYDRICMFVARAESGGVELNEEMDGWQAFCEALPQVLPGCAPYDEWFQAVAFPAFATNTRELYVRP